MNVSLANAGNIKITYINPNDPYKINILEPKTYPASYTCININDNVTVEAIPSSGYRFDHWGGNLSGSQNPQTFIHREAKEITAYFTGGAPPPPVTANAGPDQNASEGQQVTLDGTGSTGTIARYSWVQLSGQQVNLSNPASSRPAFTAPYVQEGGDTLIFRLTVTGNSGQTDTDSVSVHVAWQSLDLTASAGPDQYVLPRSTVFLDGSNSAPQDDIVAYQWKMTGNSLNLSGIELAEVFEGMVSFVAPGQSGWIEFELTVTGKNGSTAGDTVRITINPASGDVPVADAGSDQAALIGKTVMLDGSGSQGESLQYIWQQVGTRTVTLSGANEWTGISTQKNPTFTAPETGQPQQKLTFSLQVKATKNGLQDTDTVDILINSQAYVNGNNPPTADAGIDLETGPGAVVRLDGSGSTDPEKRIISYSWTVKSGPASIQLSDKRAVDPFFTATAASGSAEFELTVTDDAGKTDTDTVVVTWVNQPPAADAGPDQTVMEGSMAVLDGSGSWDNDDGIASYGWKQIAGAKVSLTDSATPHPWFDAPMVSVGTAVFSFRLTVKDRLGQSATDEVTITVENDGTPPIADAGPDRTVIESDIIELDGTRSTDPDGHIVSYGWKQVHGPVTVISDETSVKASFIAQAVNVDQLPLTFELTVEDDDGLTHSDRVTITIINVGELPVAHAGEDQAVYARKTVTLDASRSKDKDGVVESYEWSQISGPVVVLSDPVAMQPTFAAPDVSMGEDPAQLEFQLMVEDNDGLKSYDRVKITVNPTTRAPIADAGPDQTIEEGEMVVLDGSGSSDPDDGIKSYRWTQVAGSVTVVLSDETALKPTFEAPKIQGEDVPLSFKLVAEDFSGQQGVDHVVVTIANKSGGGSSGGCFISTLVE